MGGIDAITAALDEGLKASKEGLEVNIRLIAHPAFALTCTCLDKEEGVNVLTAALDLIKGSIESKKGSFSVISQPQTLQKDEQKDGGDEEDSDGDSGDDDKKSYKSQSDPEEQDTGMGDLNEDQP